MLIVIQVTILIVLATILCTKGTKQITEETDPVVWLCFVLSILDLVWILWTIGEMSVG